MELSEPGLQRVHGMQFAPKLTFIPVKRLGRVVKRKPANVTPEKGTGGELALPARRKEWEMGHTPTRFRT